MNTLNYTIFWVSLSYWLNKLCLPDDLNHECAETSPVSPTWSLSSGRSEHCRGFTMSVMNGLDKWICKGFPITPSYELDEFGLPGDLNKYAEVSPGSLTIGLFQDHLSSTTALSMGWVQFPRKPGQWMCRKESSTVSPIKGLFKTIFWVKISA